MSVFEANECYEWQWEAAISGNPLQSYNADGDSRRTYANFSLWIFILHCIVAKLLIIILTYFSYCVLVITCYSTSA